MCGILLVITKDEDQRKVSEEYILPLIKKRGPDATSFYSSKLTNRFNETFTLYFVGSVLHLRGNLTKQPIVKENANGDANILLWNGEVFGGDLKVLLHENDTEVLFNKLENIDSWNTDDEMVKLFTSIQGPYSFVYFQGSEKKLWFGRDYFGRRSLLKNFSTDFFSLSSVGHNIFQKELSEVPAKCLYCIDLQNIEYNCIQENIKTLPVKMTADIDKKFMDVEHRCTKPFKQEKPKEKKGNRGKVTCEDVDIFSETCDQFKNCFIGNDKTKKINKENKCSDMKDNTINISKVCETFLIILEDSVRTRVCNVPEISQKKTEISQENSDVSQKNYNISEAETEVLQEQSENSQTDSFIKKIEETSINCSAKDSQMAQEQSHQISEISSFHKKSKVGVLFSGGIDSVVLAALAHRCLPLDEPIDLINVAFAQKQKLPQNVKKKHIKKIIESEKEEVNFNVPDRVTGREALKELQTGRKWNFIEVDVTLVELQKERSSIISNLVYPLDTVLDDSIGCAIWFAARGIGKKYIVKNNSLELDVENYRSPVKVLLCGMGADEQLGGYARHRTKFEVNGWAGLHEEMLMEIERISTRNLGRDDRCISDHGRESRFPFLDENVVDFLQQLPVCAKCDPRLPRGVGEKILLREVAQLLELDYVSKLPKRAIQFGSKIAKLESSKEKGSHSCARLHKNEI